MTSGPFSANPLKTKRHGHSRMLSAGTQPSEKHTLWNGQETVPQQRTKSFSTPP
jgi:hypothetical protein